jgi:fructose-bisphosphate aldolase, class II
MKSLKEILQEASNKKVAIGHFNISDLVALKAIFESARELNAPVMIGTSEGERDFIDVHEAVALVRGLRNSYDFPIFLNADHTHSLDKVKIVAEAGYDEILFDGSKLPFEENVKQTKQAVEIVKSIDPNILVEGEIGYIGSSSAILDKTPEGAALTPESLTTPEEAQQFIRETGIDILAPAVGNMHGLLKEMVTGDAKKRLDIERIKKIKEVTGIMLTLHGGSGTADEDFISAVQAGINIIHINTEIRIAWRHGIENGLAKNPKEIAPYKILPEVVENIKKIVIQRLKLFNGIS